MIANKIRVPFSSLIGVPKNGGPNWTKNKKNTKCQITKKVIIIEWSCSRNESMNTSDIVCRLALEPAKDLC